MLNKSEFETRLYQNIDLSWQEFFAMQKQESYYQNLIDKVYHEYSIQEVYPSVENIFRVFKDSSLDNTKVVIIGQDPYHTPMVADGLAFSSQAKKIPPSLKNIFKELKNDLNIENNQADLTKWSKQGVMLLNTALSVEKGKANSHQKIGWNEFVIALIKYLDQKQKLVFVLWGNHAKSYAQYLKNSYVIEGFHPSPFSAKKYFGGQYFSRINAYLKKEKIKEIDWRL